MGSCLPVTSRTLFSRIYLLILTLFPAAFLLHFIVIGAKKFSHTGRTVYFFSLFCRVVHWIAALSFSLLVITGLMIVFGKILGGGAPVRAARSIHLVSTLILAVAAAPMLLIWIKDMLPMPCDIKWILILGGYLSTKKRPVPAGKFNAGQKTWFWLATIGSGVMIYSGYLLFTFRGATDQLRLMAMIHNFLGALLVGLFIIHLYMSLFAVKGAISSMINGSKPEDEVRILYSMYKF